MLMELYNYYNEVKQSVLDFMEENDYTTENKDSEELYDECFISDSVTGNASGSFFFNTFAAEEAICHNWCLIAEAWEEFGLEAKELSRGGRIYRRYFTLLCPWFCYFRNLRQLIINKLVGRFCPTLFFLYL